MFEFEITELNRRVANMVRLGRVAAIDYAGSIPKVRVRIAPLTTAWLPLLSLRAGPDKQWWPVEVDEQVVVISPSGELNQGVVLGSIFQNRFPSNANDIDVHRTTYSDGAVIEYNKATHRLRASLPDGASTQLISTGGVSIVGDVTVEGNITASEEITDHTRSMQEDRDIYNRHVHPGVATGKGSTKMTTQSQ